jgi:hypothetical protein
MDTSSSTCRACSFPLTLALALAAAACGGGGSDGSGGSGGAGGSGTTGVGAAGGSGGSTSDVALVDEALDGACPAGSKMPGTGVTPGSDLHRVTLSDYPDAKCNDGSPAIMYVRRASVPAAESSWIVFLQFGGSCQSWEVCRDRWCSYNTTYDAAKMSTRFAPETSAGRGLFNRTNDNAFAAANQVFVYYCSSDQWLGQNDDVVLQDPDGAGPDYRLHFRGFSILEAVDDALSKGVTSDDGVETMPKLTDATRILFAGGSAGSAGQTHALDWWAAKHPGVETAGYFDAATDPMVEDIPNATVAAQFESILPERYQITFLDTWGAHLDESCLAAHPGDDAYLCSLGSHVRLNHITTPFFVRNDLRDPVSHNAFEQLGLSIEDYGVAMESTMARYTTLLDDAEEKDAMTRAPGVMASNCKQHIVTMNDAWFGLGANPATVDLPGGMPITVHDALGAWINGTSIQALDTQPSTKSKCLMTTADQ